MPGEVAPRYLGNPFVMSQGAKFHLCQANATSCLRGIAAIEAFLWCPAVYTVLDH